MPSGRSAISVSVPGSSRGKTRRYPLSGMPSTTHSTIRSTLFDIVRRREWPAPYTGRALQNEFTDRWRGREAELMHNLAREEAAYEEARRRGDLDIAVLHAGEAVDLIDEVLPAAEIVARTVAEATRLIAGASNRYKANEQDAT